MKSWLQDMEMCSTHNEEKLVVAERCTRTLKNKSINIWLQYQKIVYLDKLSDIVNKYNYTYYSTIKMKPIYLKPST